MKIITTTLLSATLLMAASQICAQGNPHRGEEKAKATCAACHDASGISKTQDFPILAGQHDDYLREALHAYKRGDRKNVIMKGQAAVLTDRDIEDLAAYYSQQPTGLKTAN